MENNGQPAEAENFPLDEAMISILSEIKQQVQILQAQRQGALVHFIRQHKLQGNWQEAENGKELIKIASQPMQQAS